MNFDPNAMTKVERNSEFDFFLGDWAIQQRVKQRDGSWREFPATTKVENDLDGTILLEHWEGITLLPWEGMTEPELRRALSVRAFDPLEQLWNIHWIDSRNRAFIPTSSGRFVNGRGEFFSLGGRGRIAFDEMSEQGFHWDFSILENGTWSTQWIMEMERIQ